ncbi:uncharacterized protein LAESUDRAFT_724753 [Laetiporus sulphureus 93-53]|uniref:DUF6533 domain-containing protein n=1 Tax=Laetiporus sulphureus 93-53 TaxID=1314785 RepID=A0A165EU00_9APHY|nr:uncharacterized protein LAESUDRAFT_724753 [Laetiporus sulphureus 93-53]KZT07758.1 hypothetical protein LAESUDRAFT_724753 [Laetiporus sulphureus 93-53]
MSNDAPTVTETGILALKLTFINTCCQMAASTLIFHEYTMTFSDEINLIWRCRATGATIIFLLNRYLALALGITIIIQTLPWNTPLSCEATIISYSIVNMLLNIVIAVFSALRAFAISGSKMLATLIVLSLGLVTVCASIYFMARSSYAYVLMIASMPVCDYHDYYSLDTFNRVIIASRICAIAADVIVIALTWYNTYKMRAIARQIIQNSLSTLIFRDGTIYFVLLLFLNIMQMAVRSVGGAITNYAASFVAPVSSILISRFMINLRSEVYGSNSDSIVASIVGNMHSSLSYTASSDDRSRSAGSASLAYEEGSSEERGSITNQLVYDGDHPTSIELSDMYSRVEVV